MIVSDGHISFAITGSGVCPEVIIDRGMGSCGYKQSDVWMTFIELFENDFNGTVGGLVKVELRLDSASKCVKSTSLGLVGFECVRN